MLKIKTICLSLSVALALSGCGDALDEKTTTSKPTTPGGSGGSTGSGGGNGGGTTTPTKTKNKIVKVYSSVDNCTTAVDVPNCDFKKGVTVLKIGGVSDLQQRRVITQVKNLLDWASDDVRKQFSQKRVVIGITEKEPDGSGPHDAFILALANEMNTSVNLDAIELVYSALPEDNGSIVDETTKTTTYQKMLQVFDYYVDGNGNTSVGSDLRDSYNGFKLIINNTPTTIRINECNYGNGQLNPNPLLRVKGTPADCTEPGEDPSPNGKEDPIHILKANLNPGATFGIIYEYKVAPHSGKKSGEITTISGTFNSTGKVGSGDLLKNDWSNQAFKPLDVFLEKYFFINK